MKRILLAAAAGATIGTTTGWLAVIALLPPLVRRSGHYGSHVPPRSR